MCVCGTDVVGVCVCVVQIRMPRLRVHPQCNHRHNAAGVPTRHLDSVLRLLVGAWCLLWCVESPANPWSSALCWRRQNFGLQVAQALPTLVLTVLYWYRYKAVLCRRLLEVSTALRATAAASNVRESIKRESIKRNRASMRSRPLSLGQSNANSALQPLLSEQELSGVFGPHGDNSAGDATE